jgi:hypothetical protein
MLNDTSRANPAFCEIEYSSAISSRGGWQLKLSLPVVSAEEIDWPGLRAAAVAIGIRRRPDKRLSTCRRMNESDLSSEP